MFRKSSVILQPGQTGGVLRLKRIFYTKSSQVNPFDPMEKAVINIGDQFLKSSEHIHSGWVMEKEYPLSRDLLAMSRVFSHTRTKEQVIAVKGAPEAIFDLCHLNNETISGYEKAVPV